jgi:hypothetical protein
VKAPLEMTEPPGAVTPIVPVAPLPTVAVIEVSLTTVKTVAAVPPKVAAVAPVKFVPVRVITDPVPPLVGVNDAIVGAGMNVKAPVLVAMPPSVATVIVPLAPPATVAVSDVSLTTVNADAAILPKVTALALVKVVPVMVITAPAAPLVGVNEVMVGAG